MSFLYSPEARRAIQSASETASEADEIEPTVFVETGIADRLPISKEISKATNVTGQVKTINPGKTPALRKPESSVFVESEPAVAQQATNVTGQVKTINPNKTPALRKPASTVRVPQAPQGHSAELNGPSSHEPSDGNAQPQRRASSLGAARRGYTAAELAVLAQQLSAAGLGGPPARPRLNPTVSDSEVRRGRSAQVNGPGEPPVGRAQHQRRASSLGAAPRGDTAPIALDVLAHQLEAAAQFIKMPKSEKDELFASLLESDYGALDAWAREKAGDAKGDQRAIRRLPLLSFLDTLSVGSRFNRNGLPMSVQYQLGALNAFVKYNPGLMAVLQGGRPASEEMEKLRAAYEEGESLLGGLTAEILMEKHLPPNSIRGGLRSLDSFLHTTPEKVTVQVNGVTKDEYVSRPTLSELRDEVRKSGGPDGDLRKNRHVRAFIDEMEAKNSELHLGTWLLGPLNKLCGGNYLPDGVAKAPAGATVRD